MDLESSYQYSIILWNYISLGQVHIALGAVVFIVVLVMLLSLQLKQISETVGLQYMVKLNCSMEQNCLLIL